MDRSRQEREPAYSLTHSQKRIEAIPRQGLMPCTAMNYNRESNNPGSMKFKAERLSRRDTGLGNNARTKARVWSRWK